MRRIFEDLMCQILVDLIFRLISWICDWLLVMPSA
ncbi:hypothetical protein SAMN05428955_3409 [Pseudomonas sp. 7SR1]|nr:hypothetical protein SAMN05428955_3409 [Pseudomonas sp. 7SR1]